MCKPVGYTSSGWSGVTQGVRVSPGEAGYQRGCSFKSGRGTSFRRENKELYKGSCMSESELVLKEDMWELALIWEMSDRAKGMAPPVKTIKSVVSFKYGYPRLLFFSSQNAFSKNTDFALWAVQNR